MASLAVAALVPIGGARTIVLVYDDSGSMNAESRFEFASYATQNLLALLSPDDRLEVVRMSAPDRWTVLLPERSQQEGIATIAQWPVGASTPYLTVQTAAARLRALGQSNTDPDEDFWFVFFSDGAFQEGGGDVPLEVIRQRLALDLAELRDDFEGRRLGVLFLGIGPDADRHADVWETSGAIVDTAVTSREIIDALFRIAALVTGRDPQADAGASTLVARPGAVQGTLDVTTALPLQRLVVFYQGTRASSLRVLDGRSSIRDGPAATVAPVRSSEPLRTAGGGVYGSVTGVVGARFGAVMGPGTFTLVLEGDAPVDLADLRFLPEVALGLEVERIGGSASTCAGETVTFRARLTDSTTGSPVDLRALTGLEIVAQVEGETERRSAAFRALDATTYEVDLTVPTGRSSVSVTARYPGYFNFRSQLFAFDGASCAAGFSVALADPRLAAPATFRSDLHVGAATSLTVAPSRSVPVDEAAFDVAALDLPSGVAIEVAGARLDARPVRLVLPLERPVPLRVWTSAGFDVPTVAVTLQFEPASDAIVASAITAALELVLDPVQLRVAPSTLGPFDLEPTMDAAYAFASEAVFELVAEPPFDADPGELEASVTARPVPEGLEVRVQGVPLNAGDPSATIPLSATGPNRVEAWVRAGLSAAAPETLRLRFEGSDARIAWRDAVLDVAFAIRDRALALEVREPWATSYVGLAASPPFVVVPTVGARTVPVEELANWTVEASVPSRLGVEAQVDPSEQRLLVRVAPARWPLFTRTGRVEVEVRATTPFGEEVVERFELDIADAPFLERWGLPILYLALAAFALWIAVAYARKPKFVRGAGFRITPVIERPPGAMQWDAPGADGADVKGAARDELFARSAIGLSRFWPFGPQRAVVGPFQLRAAARRGSVYVDPVPSGTVLDEGSPQVRLNGLRVDRRERQLLDVGDTLTVDEDAGASEEHERVVRREYAYRKDLRHI